MPILHTLFSSHAEEDGEAIEIGKWMERRCPIEVLHLYV